MTPATLTEPDLRALLGRLARRMGSTLHSMNTHDVVAAVQADVDTLAAERGLAAVDPAWLHHVANRWLSESALAAALAEDEDG